MNPRNTMTLEDEIAAALAGPETLQPRDAWVGRAVAQLSAGLPIKELCEVATEAPDGHLDAIRSLLEGLILRHAKDDAALAALIAIQDYHLPRLLDGANGRA